VSELGQLDLQRLSCSSFFIYTTRSGDVDQSISSSLLPHPPCTNSSNSRFRPIQIFSTSNQLLKKKELVIGSEKRMVNHEQEL
jgi:hypothetical protein